MTKDEIIEDLQERVAYLESELGLALELDKLAKLRRRYGAEPLQTRMLLALHHRRGGLLSPAQLADAMHPNGSEQPATVVDTTRVHISRLRRNTAARVQNVAGIGYRLDDAMRAEIDAILALPLESIDPLTAPTAKSRRNISQSVRRALLDADGPLDIPAIRKSAAKLVGGPVNAKQIASAVAFMCGSQSGQLTRNHPPVGSRGRVTYALTARGHALAESGR